MSATEAKPLLEREAELAALDTAIEDSRAGRGRLMLIGGAAGVGKSSLAAIAAARAAEQGAEVLCARSGEFELELPYGVLRQLFEPVLARVSAAERDRLGAGAARPAVEMLDPRAPVADPQPSDEESIRHGLYWLTANLAGRKPLCITIDDAQWADVPTLRWLSYLVRRVDGIPALIVVTTGEDRPSEAGPMLAQMAAEPVTVALRPSPLTRDAAHLLVSQRLEAEVDPEFAEACRTACGGKPLLMRELTAALHDDGVAPVAANASRVMELAPSAVSRLLLLRLAHLPAEATALARAVAVLAPRAELRLAATVAGLSADEASRGADGLVGAEVLSPERPLSFLHPILRAAVYADLPAGERSRSHAHAASLLEAEGEHDRSAAHLLHTDPAGNAETVALLRRAARSALAAGAPPSAARLLRRALAEPVEPALQSELLLELGSAEIRAGEPEALEHLQTALDEAGDDDQHGARIALELGGALVARGRPADGAQVLLRVAEAVRETDADLSLRLEADLLAAVRLDAQSTIATADIRARARGLTGRSSGERVALASASFEAMLDGEAAPVVGDLAERAFAEPLGPEHNAHSPAFAQGAFAAAAADRADIAQRFWDHALSQAYARGSSLGVAIATCWRSNLAFRTGDVPVAETEARNSLSASEDHSWELGGLAALAFLIEALLERGEQAESEQLLERAGMTAEIPPTVLANSLLFSRGRLRLAADRPAEALDDLLRCGRRLARWATGNPAAMPWRSCAALAHHALGEVDAAHSLALEELELARGFGAPRAIGIALRTAGMVQGDEALLRESVLVLERSIAPLELARAQVELGAAMRRGGDRAASREHLRSGLELADRSGATVLAEQAREELVAGGARPRRSALSGVEGLTPSEGRVASLAAEGMTNRDVAQTLFVTTKTVEMHLSRAYGKLGIGSRDELAAALAPSDGEEAA